MPDGKIAALSILEKEKIQPRRLHWGLFFVACGIAYVLFVHPDVVETANHSYIFLQSVFSGRFLHFYTDVVARDNTLYYINYAHYNVVIYAIFGIAQLPLFILNTITGLPVNEVVLYYLGKGVSAGFFIGCIPIITACAKELGMDASTSRWASLFTMLWPPAFFSAMIMGQYDSLCLFFTMVALLCWLRGKTLPFVLWMGVGMTCKFFPILLLIPLLLLQEKRPLHIIKYGALSLWLLLPTTLLFRGRNGDMSDFNGIMSGRIFAATIPGALDIPIFPVLFLLLCFVAYLVKLDKMRLKQMGIWFCLGVYGLLFIFVTWHPQWVILLAPFIVLTTFMEKNRLPWFALDIVLAAGFFIFCAYVHSRQLEANLLDLGLVGLLTGFNTGLEKYNPILFYYNLVPIIQWFPMVLFGGAVIGHILFKIPTPWGTPASYLSSHTKPMEERYLPLCLWGVFGVGISVWLLPTLFTWLKCFHFL